MPNPVVHFEVIGRDAATLQDFYAKVFGWEMQEFAPAYKMAMPGEADGINGGIGGTADGNDFVTVYVQVADVEEALQSVEKSGGSRLRGPDHMGTVTVALFKDTEGHIIGLVHPDQAPEKAE